MNTSKIIRGVVSNGRYTVTAPIVKEDYGLYLKIEGVELPSTYEVDFSNSESNGTSVTMIGNADGVLIPRQFIDSGKDVFAFLYHVGSDFGRTVYKFRIPNKVRPDRTDETPTPEEQSTIDQLIGAMNTAVAQTAQDKADADASAQSAQGYAEQSETARDTAQTYANNAQTSATSAQTSASQASASATASAHSASEAQSASTNAETYALNSGNKAVESAQSAQASANSATQAQGYAQSASASAQSASGYASQAQSSAQTASSKASEASQSAQTASAKADSITGLTAQATTLPSGSSASARYDAQTGVMSFGIPKGDTGDSYILTTADKQEISEMVGDMFVVTVSGRTPTITAQANTRYVCGELDTLDFTPSASGICDIIFTSGTTATVLTLPNTVKMPGGFGVNEDTVYELNFLNGLGVYQTWAVT